MCVPHYDGLTYDMSVFIDVLPVLQEEMLKASSLKHKHNVIIMYTSILLYCNNDGISAIEMRSEWKGTITTSLR